MKKNTKEIKGFTLNKDNLDKAKKIISQYPSGRQQSAILPLLDLAQRQNGGFLSIPVIEYIAELLNIAYIRAYEVASFYSMFNLKPVGKNHIQVCGTTPCWLRGAGEIIDTCKNYLKINPGEVTEDGKFSLIEVECLGACVNAPMVQINDNFYEDLTPELMSGILAKLSKDQKVTIGSQIGRKGSKAKD